MAWSDPVQDVLEMFGGNAFQGTDSICLQSGEDEEAEETIESEQTIESQQTPEEVNPNTLPWW